MSNHDFLRGLLQSPGPSSYETAPASLWREQARDYGAEVRSDAYGNSFASFGSGGSPRIMLAGHVDEIGLLVTYVDDSGLLYFTGIGIGDGSGLAGQRVRVVSEKGQYPGVIGRKPDHLVSGEERSKRLKLEELWIDIGAEDREDALKRVEPGSFAVFEAPPVQLSEHRWASKAMDDRLGAYIVLEAARSASTAGSKAHIVAAATTQEEIAGVGANVAAYAVEPDLAVALDLGHASDVPNVDSKLQGEMKLGKGPILEFGSTVHRGLAKRLADCADRHSIPLQYGFSGRRTSTDADDISKVRSGAPTILLSIPNRYMHSPVELIDMRDVEWAVELLAHFLRELESVEDLLPQG